MCVYVCVCMITQYQPIMPIYQLRVKVGLPTVNGVITAQHVIHLRDPLQPKEQHITQANTHAISPLLSEFKMEKQCTSEEENALKGT